MSSVGTNGLGAEGNQKVLTNKLITHWSFFFFLTTKKNIELFQSYPFKGACYLLEQQQNNATVCEL